MPRPQPIIQPVTLTVGSYSSNQVTISRTIDNDANLAAFAISVKEEGALTDHFFFKDGSNPPLEHNNYTAVGGDLSSSQGVPLGCVACAPRYPFTSGQPGHIPQLSPWAGRINDLDMLNALRVPVITKYGANSKQAKELAERLALAYRLPRSRYPMTLWPLQGGKDWLMRLRRKASGTSITEAILWCVKLPDDVYRNVCTFAELPFWTSKVVLSSSGAAAVPGEQRMQIDAKEGYGFLLKQIFAHVRDNNSDALDETYAQKVKSVLRVDGIDIYDGVARDRIALSTLYPMMMQDYDRLRDLDLLINPKTFLMFDFEYLETAQIKQTFLTAYGLVAEADKKLRQARMPGVLAIGG